MVMRMLIYWLLVLILTTALSQPVSAAAVRSASITSDMRQEIAWMIEEVTHNANIPGTSVVLVHGEDIYEFHSGYADMSAKIPTDSETLYEIASNSKAFTALGILLLAQQGKLDLNDPVQEYLPWFQVYYKGEYRGIEVNEEVGLTLANLYHHTSGIPSNTVGFIPEGTSDGMLERTVRALIGKRLDFYPGEKFQYATVNYDILGLVIESITGMPFEEYMEMAVLRPLGLNHTYLFQEDALKSGNLSEGYILTGFQAREYDAPRYRGNTPAGYFIANTADMARWMRIHMGMIEIDADLMNAVQASHEGDHTVAPNGPFHYGGGWWIHMREPRLEHSGANPNYSSSIVLDTSKSLGVCVLSNLNSIAASYLAGTIMNFVEQRESEPYKPMEDSYKMVDTLFSLVSGLGVLASVSLCVFIVRVLWAIVCKKRIRVIKERSKLIRGLTIFILIVFTAVCVYYIPNILFERLPWSAVRVWLSPMVISGCIIGYITFVLFLVYVYLIFTYPNANDREDFRNREKNYLTLIALSVLNGVNSALIIYIINESFNRNLEYSEEFLLYFLFTVVFFVYTLKLMEGRLIEIANEYTYEKRIGIIEAVLHARFQLIERIGKERIYSGLSNDCEAIANYPGLVVAMLSSAMTLLFCMLFLLSKSMMTFLFSVGLVLINSLIGILISRRSSVHLEKSRNIQDIYFTQMHDMINGFKELALNRKRRAEFHEDLKKYSRLSVDLKKNAAIKFLNFNIYNRLMYNLVFGIVVFVLPILIIGIDISQLRENLFIVFYMLGPVTTISANFPQLVRIRVNLNRINQLLKTLSADSITDENEWDDKETDNSQAIKIDLRDIVYQYSGSDGENEILQDVFTLGPISTSFTTGEIVYVTGGNGSGKSTLAKIITGLYQPKQGQIVVNCAPISLSRLNELFASVFNDYNLFKKLYGLDYSAKEQEFNRYMQTMQLDKKVKILENEEVLFEQLSTGQSRRLAFIISCMEDKPFMIFDEWAAEQDPQFREFFYTVLLPQLKDQNKGINCLST